MILAALNKAGGERYLVRQAQENPNAFLSLVGRILPKEVVTEGGSILELHLVAARNVSAELLEGQAEPPKPAPPLTIEGSIPTE
jgi:hypothetical protein